MSLVLSDSIPKIIAKTDFFDDIVTIYYRGEKDIDIEIPFNDFCHLVEYVLTNTDLRDLSDPRLRLLLKFKNYRLEKGFNANGVRLALDE